MATALASGHLIRIATAGHLISLATAGTATAGHLISAATAGAATAGGASGYHGPPELTVPRAFTEWTFDPWMTALVVILGGAYLAGTLLVSRRNGGDWPVARRVWFLGLGLGFLVIATMSWVGAYSPVLFYARAVQTVLLVLLVPLFLALGRPITLACQVFPRASTRIEAAIRSRPARIITFPAITTLALVGVPFVMYFTSWYTHVFQSGTVRELTYLVLMAPGFLFFWTLLRVDPVPKEYPYAVSMWITGAEVIGDAFFGIAVIADQTLLAAPYYRSLGLHWGPSLATDQVLGGGVLWILGDLVGLPFLAAQLIQLMREDESEATRIDAELDAQEALSQQTQSQQAPSQPALSQQAHSQQAQSQQARSQQAQPDPALQPAAHPVPDPGDEGQPEAPQPWWENDPRFTSRFKPTS